MGNNERSYRPRNAPRNQGRHNHHNRSPSHSPDRSDEDDSRGPLSQAIMEAPTPPGMEKPSHLKEYDGIVDPVDHIDGFEAMLHYHNIEEPIKFRFSHDFGESCDGLV